MNRRLPAPPFVPRNVVIREATATSANGERETYGCEHTASSRTTLRLPREPMEPLNIFFLYQPGFL